MFTKIRFAAKLARVFDVFLIMRMGRILFVSSIMMIVCSVSLPKKLGSAAFREEESVKKAGSRIFPQAYFVEPTDSSLSIAGNFGEIRPNHFHAGLDVKTAGREGLMVYAAAEGYVSRVKISATGYGKALYITHPNGFVTVYAHLQRLYGKIAEYVQAEQYKFETFEIDINVPKDVLRVKQCDTIAISGNTGGSQSPHLHFEVRDEKTEVAYNPFLFGYRVKDTVPPQLLTLAVYPANDSSTVNGKHTSRKTRIYGSRGKYRLSAAEKITVSGDAGFGIETYDYANIKEAGKLGAYSVDLYIDGKRIYYHEMNEISFDESRYINSHIDYAEEAKSNREIQKCFRDPNNHLSIYQCVVDEGLYRFEDTAHHSVTFIVKDYFKNTSKLSFQVKSQKHALSNAEESKGLIQKQETGNRKQETTNHFSCSEENIFETNDIKVRIPPCSLYEDIDFDYKVSKDTLPGTFAPVHTLHNDAVPHHYNYTLSIRVKNIPEKYRSKALLVSLDGKNGKYPRKGTYEQRADGSAWMTTETKYFGRYTVVLDTVPPSIKPYNIYFGKNMSRAKTISVIVGDNLSGIASYRAVIDGKWVLMEYEPKKSMLFYEFPASPQPATSVEAIKPGEHIFEIEVTDAKGNARTWKTKFIR